MASTIEERVADIARLRGIRQDEVSAAESDHVDLAISLVRRVLPARRVSIDLEDGKEYYERQQDVLVRSGEPVEGDGASVATRRAFAHEAVILVKAVGSRWEIDLERYQAILRKSPIDLTEYERQVLEDPHRDFVPLEIEVPQRLEELAAEVQLARKAGLAEHELALIVQRHGQCLVEREGKKLRDAGVPDTSEILNAVAEGNVDDAARLIRQWRDWERRYTEEQVINRMLKAVAYFVADYKIGRKPDDQRSGARESPYRDFDDENSFTAKADNGRLRVNGRPVKGSDGVRNNQVIQGLLVGDAFMLARQAFERSNRRLGELYTTLAGSALLSEEERAKIMKSASKHQNGHFQWSKLAEQHSYNRYSTTSRRYWTPSVRVNGKTIGELEQLVERVEELRENEALVAQQITEHAIQIAAVIREQLDTGEMTVRLAKGYEIRTVTKRENVEAAETTLSQPRSRRLPIIGRRRQPEPPAQPEPATCRVIVDAKRTNGEPVEPVPWRTLNQSVAQAFVQRSGLLLQTMQAKPPVIN